MKNIIITGATGAVGKATALEFCKNKNINLVLAGRNISKLETLKSELLKTSPGVEINIIEMDLGDLTSIKRSGSQIKETYPQIDGLVNIAAIYKNEKVLTKQGYETMFATNHLGPFYLTNILIDNIKNTPNAKVLTVSAPSTTKIDFDNLNGEKKFSGFTAFGASKMMNLMFSFKLAKQFNQGTQASIAFHPGLVKSELLNDGPKILAGFLKLISSPPQKTAATIVNLIHHEPAKELNGKFYDKNLKALKAAPQAHDETLQNKLWELSWKIIGSI